MTARRKRKRTATLIEQQQQQQADAKFLRDYRAAREMILAGNYQGGIAAMHALGHDEHADVANYIGYAYRKLGSYEDSQDLVRGRAQGRPEPRPHLVLLRHVADGTGQPAQGARRSCRRSTLICGNTTCEEYRQLKAVIDGKASY